MVFPVQSLGSITDNLSLLQTICEMLSHVGCPEMTGITHSDTGSPGHRTRFCIAVPEKDILFLINYFLKIWAVTIGSTPITPMPGL
jgi:hypothetical protein